MKTYYGNASPMPISSIDEEWTEIEQKLNGVLLNNTNNKHQSGNSRSTSNYTNNSKVVECESPPPFPKTTNMGAISQWVSEMRGSSSQLKTLLFQRSASRTEDD